MNLSVLSRADLVSDLLSPLICTSSTTLSHVCDSGAHPDMPATADTVLAHRLNVARELLLRDLREQMHRGPALSSPQVLRDWLRLKLADLPYEVFSVLWLDNRNHLIEYDEMFRGTLSQTCVYPREVVKQALARNSAAAVLVHNHPSGLATASRADELLTQALKSALSLVDVRVVDHFIVAGDQVVSFAETGLI